MTDTFCHFTSALKKSLLANEKIENSSFGNSYICIKLNDNQYINLDLEPFSATPMPVSAFTYFDGVKNLKHLLDAYITAQISVIWESDISEAAGHVSSYAGKFLQDIIEKAKTNITDIQAQLIADWVKKLDIYAAVKAVESLLYSHADLKLLEIAESNDWCVHFDHLAIRCGSQASLDAETIVNLLKEQHGYVSPRNENEAYYQFSDGWNAYPLYKILQNGQVVRLFIDQSDSSNAKQIIQHWNRIYGYTAHHLAIRVTRKQSDRHCEVMLSEVITVLHSNGIDVLAPTGEYTLGLLQQVFTRPELNSSIPAELLAPISLIDVSLTKILQNAKLLELVSRAEMPAKLAKDYFSLYNLQFDASNPLHSAPCYQYFLPDQAAHVIKTSTVPH